MPTDQRVQQATFAVADTVPGPTAASDIVALNICFHFSRNSSTLLTDPNDVQIVSAMLGER